MLQHVVRATAGGFETGAAHKEAGRSLRELSQVPGQFRRLVSLLVEETGEHQHLVAAVRHHGQLEEHLVGEPVHELGNGAEVRFRPARANHVHKHRQHGVQPQDEFREWDGHAVEALLGEAHVSECGESVRRMVFLEELEQHVRVLQQFGDRVLP